MFINPKIAIEEGWIKHPDCNSLQDWENKKFISPNAIDFTLDKLFSVNTNNTFVLTEDEKQHRGGQEITPVEDRKSNLPLWTMTETVYDGMSDMYVKVPEGIVAWLVPRSTINRNGLFLKSGIYDSSFQGNIGFVMYNLGGKSVIVKGARIGQIIFAESENAKQYEGGYNTVEGQHWNK